MVKMNTARFSHVCSVLLTFTSIVNGQGLSEEEKAEMLNAHNYYRSLVDPIAANMLKMEWSDELAYMAQFWAAGCEYAENEMRHSQATQFDFIGESLAATASYTVNYTQLIGQEWFAERIYFNYYTSTCSNANGNGNNDGNYEACGRYIQLVWARTYAVGCGAFRCAELRGAENANENALFFVCNYGPGGNFYGEPPYQTGRKPCEACPYNRPYCVNRSLCSESGTAGLEAYRAVYGLLLISVLVTIYH